MKQLRQQQCSTSTSIHIVYIKPKKVLRQNKSLKAEQIGGESDRTGALF